MGRCQCCYGASCDSGACLYGSDNLTGPVIANCHGTGTAPKYSMWLGDLPAAPFLGGLQIMYNVGLAWFSNLLPVTGYGGCCGYYRWFVSWIENPPIVFLKWEAGGDPLGLLTGNIVEYQTGYTFSCNCSTTFTQIDSLLLPFGFDALPKTICVTPLTAIADSYGYGSPIECPPCGPGSIDGINQRNWCVQVPAVGILPAQAIPVVGAFCRWQTDGATNPSITIELTGNTLSLTMGIKIDPSTTVYATYTTVVDGSNCAFFLDGLPHLMGLVSTLGTIPSGPSFPNVITIKDGAFVGCSPDVYGYGYGAMGCLDCYGSACTGDCFYIAYNAQTAVVTETTPGTSTYSAPDRGRLQIEVWGAGGSGGSGIAAAGSQGGGAGGYAKSFLAVVAGQTFTYTVGAGGAGRTTAGDGNDGGNTTISGTYIYGNGGQGGQGPGGSKNGNGGTAGDNGSGDPAAIQVTGGYGFAATGINGGDGGAPYVGGSGGHGGISPATAATAGNAPGGGGGGSSGVSNVSGAGADGKIVFTFTKWDWHNSGDSCSPSCNTCSPVDAGFYDAVPRPQSASDTVNIACNVVL